MEIYLYLVVLNKATKPDTDLFKLKLLPKDLLFVTIKLKRRGVCVF